MKLSARNVLPGKVISVAKGATTAHVKVELAPGLTVFSAI
ncbi:MAG: transporter, partial [Bradyrhizobium sp.]|nr:transporter [Bradyrhizobium sp.]